jgi:recombinational DNA repair protein (RecF pathway)
VGYHKYNTPTFILDRYDIGESDVILDAFTRDIGRVRATAESVRTMRSKLRYNLQIYTLVETSFIRGKARWRVVGAEEHTNIYHHLAQSPTKLAAFCSVLGLLRRLFRHGRPNVRLFYILANGAIFLCEHENDEERILLTEQLMVLRILDCLGYLQSREELHPFVRNIRYSEDLLHSFSDVRRDAVTAINHTLRRIQV